MTKSDEIRAAGADPSPDSPPLRWEHGVVELDREIAAASRGPSLALLGDAQVLLERSGPLVSSFLVRTGGRRLGHEVLTNPFLSAAAAGAPQHPVERVSAWEDDRFEVHAVVDGPVEGLQLFARSDPALPLVSLRARLAAQLGTPLPPAAAALAGPPRVRVRARERHESFEGVESDLAELAAGGFAVVTGSAAARRMLLGRLVSGLVSAERTVLYVSSENRLIDEMVLTVKAAAGDPRAGTLLRVGLASLALVGDDDRLTVHGAALALSGEEADRLTELEAEAAELMSAPPSLAVDTAGESRRLGQVRANLAALEEDARVLEARRRGLGGAAPRAPGAPPEPVEEAARLHRRVDELERILREAAAEVAASAAGLGRLSAGAAELTEALAGPRGVRAQAELSGRVAQLAAAAETARLRTRRRNDAAAELDQVAARLRELGISRRQLEELELSGRQTRAARDQIDAEIAALDTRRTELSRLASVLAAPSATLAAPWDPPVRARLTEIVAEHNELRQRIIGRAPQAMQEAPFVATTLVQLGLNPLLGDRRFDYVLVDAAAGLGWPNLLWAASRAERGLVLADEGPVVAPTDAADAADAAAAPAGGGPGHAGANGHAP